MGRTSVSGSANTTKSCLVPSLDIFSLCSKWYRRLEPDILVSSHVICSRSLPDSDTDINFFLLISHH